MQHPIPSISSRLRRCIRYRTHLTRVGFRHPPRPNLTPGSVRIDGHDCKDICGHKEHRSSLPHGLRDEILKRYGLPPGTHPDYEIDHLIPVCLGSDDPSNLWAEPRRSIESKWNAEAKDRLEHMVCEMVCDQQLDLATMQKFIAEDWIAAYIKIYEPTDGVGEVNQAASRSRSAGCSRWESG